MTKTRSTYLGLIAVLFSPMAANADSIVWQLNDFDLLDGGVATGVFTYDADTNTYSDVAITTTAGTISGSPFPGASYSFVRTFGSSPGATIVSLLASFPADLTGVSNFGMQFDAPLTNSGGTHGLNFFTEAICANASCSAVFAGGRGVAAGVPNSATITSIVQVPEPGTLALFGLGLAAMGFSRRRKRT